MKFTATISAQNTSVKICDIDRRKSDANTWAATIFIGVGTTDFGGGTVKIQFSPDNGTTKFDSKDYTGTAISATAAGMFNTQPIGNGDKLSDFISVYATIGSATNPNVPITVFDNR